MWLAGVSLQEVVVQELIDRLHAAELGVTARTLREALDEGTTVATLEPHDYEAILYVLDDSSPVRSRFSARLTASGLGRLRDVLRHEVAWQRQRTFRPGASS